MKTFVIFASCIAVASARGSTGGQSFGGNSGGSHSGGYSNRVGSSGNEGYSSGGGSSRSANSGYSNNRGGGSGGYSNSLSGNNGGFGSLGFGNSGLGALMSLMAQNGYAGSASTQLSSGGADRVSGQSATGGYSESGVTGAQQGGQIKRYVSIHVAPEENTPREARVIRAGGEPDTHVNIIFVKAPSGSSEQQTEVVLPEPPQQKTLVYVLIKRPTEGENNVKIRAPPPTKPSKPEVYFIRYKSDLPATGGADNLSGPGTGYSGSGAGGYSGSSGASGSPSSSYGAPYQQDRGSSGGGYQ